MRWPYGVTVPLKRLSLILAISRAEIMSMLGIFHARSCLFKFFTALRANYFHPITPAFISTINTAVFPVLFLALSSEKSLPTNLILTHMLLSTTTTSIFLNNKKTTHMAPPEFIQ